MQFTFRPTNPPRVVMCDPDVHLLDSHDELHILAPTSARSWNNKRPYVELYDHSGDDMGRWTYERFENVNVAAQFPDVVANLSQQLRNFVDQFH